MPTLGLGGLIYGSEGMGKTSVSLRFPPPVTCLSILETGYQDLELDGTVPKHCKNIIVTSFQQIKDIIESADEGTYVLDSGSGLQKLLFDYTCVKDFNSDFKKFMEYWIGPRQKAPIYLQELLNTINCKRQEGIHFIFLSHTKIDDTPNTMGANYLTHVIALDDGLLSVMKQWASFIFFLNLGIDLVEVTEKDNLKRAIEGKAKDDDNRLMYTTIAPGHSAKNRWRLPPIINMGSNADEAFRNMWKHFPAPYLSLYSPKE